MSVRIRKDNGSNRPDMSDDGLVATLANPSDLNTAGIKTFTPQAGSTIILDASTTYYVTVHEGSTTSPGFRKAVRLTSAAATGQTGWTMGTRLSRTTENARLVHEQPPGCR